MKKRLTKTLINIAIVASVLTCGATYAYFSDTISLNNHISTGDVNIILDEYEIHGKTEVTYENPKLVMPGDTISKIPRVTNLAEPCWIRAKITYGNSLEEIEGFSDLFLADIPDEWVKQGDYYYYTEVLEHGEAAELFQSVTIPEEWTELHEEQKLSIGIRTDAIQAANFKPDFNAMSPWGNTEIEKCIHETDGTIIEEKEHVKLSVEFNGEAHKLIAVPENFFVNMKTVMPGDVFEDHIDISNTTEKECEIFFRTAIEDQSDEQLDLLEKIGLSISMGEIILYEGTLKGEALSEDISLGHFPSGSSGNMEFQITVPSELKNVYALRDADVKWTFSVYEDENDPEATYKGTENVKTGDDTPFVFMVLLLAGSTFTLYYLRKILKNKKDKQL